MLKKIAFSIFNTFDENTLIVYVRIVSSILLFKGLLLFRFHNFDA